MRSRQNLQSLWITSLYGSDLKRTTNSLNDNKSTNTKNPANRQANSKQQQKSDVHPPDANSFQRESFSLQRFFRNNCDAEQRQLEALQLHHPYNYEDYHVQQQREQQQQQQQEHNAYKLKDKGEHRNDSKALQRIRDQDISETQFIGNNSKESVMDEMVFQCNNQNSIYVLNSNYSVQAPPTSISTHDEFRRLGLIEANAGCRATSLIGNGVGGLRDGDVCSSVSRSLQHKLKSFGNFNGAMLFGNNHNNNGTTSSNTTTTTYPTPQLNNNNSSSGKSILYPSNSLKYGGGGGGGGGGNGIGSNNNGIVKSNLIAKKTKFWKYLEEEKLRNEVPLTRSHCSGVKDFQDTSCTDCCATTDDDAVGCVDGNCWENSCVNKSTAMAPMALPFSQHRQQQQQSCNNKEYLPTTNTTTTTTTEKGTETTTLNNTKEYHQQYTSSNWSRSHDSNNLKPAQQQQQQAQLTQKNSAEMYKEAAELLGLSCTLCDNCRCLDCQSGYFDCDDSDSYSEFSLMDEYDVDDLDMVDIVVGGTNGQIAAGRHSYDASTATSTHKLLAMHADNMTALCCDILHTQHDDTAAVVSPSLLSSSPAASPTGDAFASVSVSDDVDDDGVGVGDGSQRVTDTATVAMQHDDEVLVASSGNDEMNIAAITMAHGGIDQVALHNIKSTMLLADGNLTLDAPPSHCNDLENCSNFNGLTLSDAAVDERVPM